MSNVISFFDAAQARREQVISSLSYHDIVERIFNVAHRHVSFGAGTLLHHLAYLIDRGHPALSYSYLCERMGITRATLSTYITELEEAKMLKVRRSRKNEKYNFPNLFEIDFTGPLGDQNTMLPLPKNPSKKGSSKIKLPPAKVVQSLDGYIVNNNKENTFSKENGRDSAQQFSTIEDALSFCEKRIVRKREAKVTKAIKPGGPLTLAGVKATWSKAMLEHYPTVPAVTLTAKDFAIFKHKITPLLASANLLTVFSYFVQNWAALRETKFKWLRAKGKDVAVAPSIPELMRYWKVFAQAYADSCMESASTGGKLQVTETDALRDKLHVAENETAHLRSEQTKMQEKIRKLERMAFAPRQEESKPRASFSARRKAAEAAYNEDVDLPDWSSNEQG